MRGPLVPTCICLGLLATNTVDAAQVAAADPVSETMVRMRLAATVVESWHLEHGAYPFADEKLRPLPAVVRSLTHSSLRTIEHDAWGSPLLYRANERAYEIISLGTDRRLSEDHSTRPLHNRSVAPIEDTTVEEDDLIFADGRFVQRPFGDRRPAFVTINAMNAIFGAAAAFAIDNNRYPGDGYQFAPVAELASALVPVYLQDMPTDDGWGRPLLYTRYGGAFILASFGSDGVQDRTYYPDLPCGLLRFDESVSAASGADLIQVCGRWLFRPSGTE
jgi:hypothetical protein